MGRAPDPIHYWLVALGKTAEWLIAYANQPGEAVGAEIFILPDEPEPEKDPEKNG